MKLIDANELMYWFYGGRQLRDADLDEFYRDLNIFCNHTTFKKYVPEFMLTRLASHLLGGKTHRFFKMLKILKKHGDASIHSIIAEIQIAVHQRLTGM